MDKEKRKISCTFTGHRPEKLDADEEHFLREMSGWWIMRHGFQRFIPAQEGGTKMTMEYAGKQGIEVRKYKR